MGSAKTRLAPKLRPASDSLLGSILIQRSAFLADASAASFRSLGRDEVKVRRILKEENCLVGFARSRWRYTCSFGSRAQQGKSSNLYLYIGMRVLSHFSEQPGAGKHGHKSELNQ